MKINPNLPDFCHQDAPIKSTTKMLDMQCKNNNLNPDAVLSKHVSDTPRWRSGHSTQEAPVEVS